MTDASDSSNLVYGIITLIVIIAIVAVWIILSNKKKRGEAWNGQVADKKQYSSTDEDGETSTSYSLIFKIEGSDKTKKVTVSPGEFSTTNIGDKFEKKLGELKPTKLG